MYILSFLKNNQFIVSKRNYLDDYMQTNLVNIDMRNSGIFPIKKVQKKEVNDNFEQYPDNLEFDKLKKQILNNINCKREIVFGAGANGLIQNLSKVLFDKKGNLVTPFYTFNQMEYAVTSLGSYTKRVFCNNYLIDLNGLKKCIDSKTKTVFICNPNNPTGEYIDSQKIINFSNLVNCYVVVDESGIEFTQRKSLLDYKKLPANLIVIRSFSKTYGLAGLRIGYLSCSKVFYDKYIKGTTKNEVSSFACVMAQNRISDNTIQDNINYIIKERDNIINELKKLNIECLPSYSNTIMTITTFSENFIDKMKKEGIGVTLVSDENNSIHIRIAVQDKKTNQKFIETLKKIMEGK